ncbi:DUF4244 domain-containing protein [Nonomuraea gerenzanensis]|nr:DUF4244 domain-containing protein [Nonomuraea gerenzanensis]
MHSPATKPDDIAATHVHAATTTPATHPGRQLIRSPTAAAAPPSTPQQHSRGAVGLTTDLTANSAADLTITAAIPLSRRSIATNQPTHESFTTAPADHQEGPTAQAPANADESSLPSPRANPHRISSSRPRTNKWLHYANIHREHGMSTAEYAVGTIAACAFAALLYKVVSSPEVQEMLTSLIDRALKTGQE